MPATRLQAFAQPRLQAFAQPRLQAFAQPRLQAFAQPRLQAFAQPRLQAFAQPRLQAVAQPRLQAVAQPRLQAVAQPRLQAVAQPRLQAVAQPRLQAVAQPRLQAVAQPRLFCGLLLVMVAAGCAPSGSPGNADLPGPAIVLAPIASPQHRIAALPTADSPAAVIRDNAALRAQATTYVASPRSKPAVIDQLTTLTLQATQAVQRLRAKRTRVGYRATDVSAARVAADALAAYLQTQAVP